MIDYIITVESAVKRFKKSIALNGVNINFERGKIHGIIGRNGSGKTILFKCICGFIPLSEGRIRINGKIVGKQIDIAKNVGIIIDTPGFLLSYSGYQNLKFLASIQNKIGRDEIRAAMNRVALDPDNKKWVGKYSLGMKQRLGIAQAIMEKPDILILDEPMNGLDNKGVDDMRQLFLELKGEGTTILLASHNSEDISYLCDTVHEMDAGSIQCIRSDKSEI